MESGPEQKEEEHRLELSCQSFCSPRSGHQTEAALRRTNRESCEEPRQDISGWDQGTRVSSGTSFIILIAFRGSLSRN